MKKNIWKIVITFILVILIFFYIFFANQLKIVIPCIFHEITGFYCPGCGITRCFNALVHLDFYQAFRYNALVVILLPLFLFYVFLTIYERLNKSKSTILHKIPNYVWWGLVVIVIVFGILRNLPDFEWLAPTSIE